MSIEEMLKDVKVEWNKLDNLLSYEQPNKYIVKNTNYSDKYSTPVLTAGQSFVLGYTDEIDGIYRASKEDPVIIFDDFTTGNHWVDFHFKVKSSALKILKAKEGVNLRYLYHYIQVLKIDTTDHKRLWISKFSQLQIPLPPLEIQEKIAKTLDIFTKYVTELQAELQNRKKQYTFFRDKLLSEDYLNKIIRSLNTDCENFVLELKKLGDICLILDSKRKPISKENRINGIYPYYGANGIHDYIDDYIYDGSFILMGEDGSVINKDNTPVLHYINNKKIWVNNHAHVLGKLNENYNLKYIYYYLSQYNVSKIVKGTPPKITQENMKNIEIYIPDIQIQNRIVKVLDKFQELIENAEGLLPEEIEKRQKQYEYYREKLLTFNSEYDTHTHISKQYLDLLKEACVLVDVEFDIYHKVEWKKLGEIGEIYGGLTGKSKLDFENGNYKYITYKNVYSNLEIDLNILEKVKIEDNEKQRELKYGDIIFTGSSESKEECGLSSVVTFDLNEKIYLNSFCFFLRLNNNNLLLPSFSKYLFRTNKIRNEIIKTASGVTRFNVSKELMKNIQIPLPPLEVQEYIVSILDKFDSLVNDISSGLPKEIELRQKQYEYYREKLLNFSSYE